MKFDLPPVDWRGLVRQPLSLGLLLSACLHLAAVALLQPAPGSNTRHTLVINARLQSAPAPEATPPTIPAAAEPEPPATLVKPVESPQSALPPVSASAAPAAPLPAATPTTPEAPARPVPASAATPATPPVAKAGPPAMLVSTGTTGPAAPSDLPSVPVNYDPTWYVARQVDAQPKTIDKIEPKYPEEARRRNLEGNVKLMLKIDDLGRVQAAEVVEAHPPGVFDEAALEAFRQARFRPAMRDGRPVRYQAYFRVDFKLE